MSQNAVLFENIHPVADKSLIAAGMTIERFSSALEPADLHAALAAARIAGIRSRTK